jgi:hypothetical protein
VTMKIIKTTNNDDNILVSDHRFDYLNQFRWFTEVHGNTRYARTSVNGVIVYMHRLILETDLDVDHIDRNGINNQDENLREATRSQNLANRPKTTGKSRYKGVSWCKWSDKWRATIMVDYKQKSLGRYESEEDAARAYNKAAQEIYGEFATLNEL